MERKRKEKVKTLPKISWAPLVIIGLVLLTMFFVSSGMWVNSNWAISFDTPPISLLCYVNVLDFEAKEVTSNITGFTTTMVTIFLGNTSMILTSDELAQNDILSVGKIQWTDGNTIALFRKKVSEGQCVITRSHMLNFTEYGVRGIVPYPIIEDFRSPNFLDDILSENQIPARMFLGFLLVLGFCLTIVPLFVYLEECGKKE